MHKQANEILGKYGKIQSGIKPSSFSLQELFSQQMKDHPTSLFPVSRNPLLIQNGGSFEF